MKKFFIGIFTMIALLTVKVQGAEIIPEYFLMEKLLMTMDSSPTYVSSDEKQELKAIQIDKKIMKMLDYNDSPFYICDSDGEKRLVRIGDYFTSPVTLSSIYVLNKEEFESNFTDKNLPKQKIETVAEEVKEEINLSEIEEKQNKNISEN